MKTLKILNTDECMEIYNIQPLERFPKFSELFVFISRYYLESPLRRSLVFKGSKIYTRLHVYDVTATKKIESAKLARVNFPQCGTHTTKNLKRFVLCYKNQ